MFIEGTIALDVSGFPSTFKAPDLISIFKGDFKIKWINDNQAILIFSTPSAAKLAYLSNVTHPFIKIKPCSAPLPLAPPVIDRSRPTTTDMVARRLIAGALGVRAPKKSQQEIDNDTLKLENARVRRESVKRERELKQMEIHQAKEKREKESQKVWDS
ncbi:hypothetical protein BC833DRAFT_583125 [Globomyces pollinis-pini]|nr:hypothetical protein BC833DRAFT_583125 [Globomyces pollinis-pini]